MASGTTFGNLRVTITADTAKMNKGLKSAEKTLRGFQKSAKSIGVNIAKSLAKITAAFSAAVVTAMVAGFKRTTQSLDEMAKTIDKVGIAADSLGKLRVAASRSGIEFKTMATAMQRMTRRISEAFQADPTKNKVALAFREMGIAMRDLKGLRPEEQLDLIADGFARVQSQSDRVRLAFTLFDTEGVAMVNVLKGGAEGLREFGREAERVGLNLTREQLGRVEKFNDTMAALKDVVGGAWQQFVIEISPAVTALVKDLRQTLIDIKFIRDTGRGKVPGGLKAAKAQPALSVISDELSKIPGLGVLKGAFKRFEGQAITEADRIQGRALNKQIEVAGAADRIQRRADVDNAAIRKWEEEQKKTNRLLAAQARVGELPLGVPVVSISK